MGKVMLSGIAPLLNVPVAVDPVLNNNSWETISKISQMGLAAKYWNVGDTKDIIVNGKVGATTFTNLKIQAFIVGIDHNAEIEGQHLIHFQIGKIDSILCSIVDGMYSASTSDSGAYTMNTSRNNRGWSDCHMRKTILGSNSDNPINPTANTLLAALPIDLRSVMKFATKYSDNKGGEGNLASSVTVTQDYLPLPAEYEYHGARSYANSAEQDFQIQYDYYKAGNEMVHYKCTETTTACVAWCRSPEVSNTYSWCTVSNKGAASSRNANASASFAPLFFV